MRKLETLRVIYAEFISRLSTDEEFLRMPEREWEKELRISRTTLAKWQEQMRVDGTWTRIVEGWRSAYDRFKPQVDMAVIQKAIREGDMKACELFYQKMEGWSPKNALELTRGKEYEGMDNKALFLEMLKSMTPEERRSLVSSSPTEKIEMKTGEDPTCRTE